MPERNLLLHDGIATHMVDAGDNVCIEREITMYRVNQYGDADVSYLDAVPRHAGPYPLHHQKPFHEPLSASQAGR